MNDSVAIGVSLEGEYFLTRAQIIEGASLVTFQEAIEKRASELGIGMTFWVTEQMNGYLFGWEPTDPKQRPSLWDTYHNEETSCPYQTSAEATATVQTFEPSTSSQTEGSEGTFAS